jgi:hypothetical protein
MQYETLRAIPLTAQVETRDGLSYLPWPVAVDQLLLRDPDAQWDFPEHQRWQDTVLVFCRVHAFGRVRTAQLPVMDHYHAAIPNPDAFAINTAMQRCLVKAIALHGIGLYLFGGEPPASGAEARLLADLEESAAGGRAALQSAWRLAAKGMAKTEADRFWAAHGRALKLIATKGGH